MYVSDGVGCVALLVEFYSKLPWGFLQMQNWKSGRGVLISWIIFVIKCINGHRVGRGTHFFLCGKFLDPYHEVILI